MGNSDTTEAPVQEWNLPLRCKTCTTNFGWQVITGREGELKSTQALHEPCGSIATTYYVLGQGY